jgi:hypothetical protein
MGTQPYKMLENELFDAWTRHLTPTGFNGKSETSIPSFIKAEYEIKKDFIFDLYVQRNLFL